VLNGGKPVDAVDVETTWESLVSRPRAQLIDVRTRAEWTYVGIPDLGAIGKRVSSSNGRPFLIRPWIRALWSVSPAN
jgi:rhodanese-related sulfurtransferase